MNWKHSVTGEVISNECYQRLPNEKKMKYNSVYLQPTHRVESSDRRNNDDDGFLLTAILASSMMDSSSDSSSGYSSSNHSDFGGGSFGGGGASSDYGSSSDSSSSSYDSGSSSSDCGSSSCDQFLGQWYQVWRLHVQACSFLVRCTELTQSYHLNAFVFYQFLKI